MPQTIVTPEIRVDCPDDQKFRLVEAVSAKLKERFGQPGVNAHPRIRDLILIDGVRVIFEDGWGLIRASNTQPALVLRFEASSMSQLQTIRKFWKNN